jgi:hypothetical protein
MKRIAAVALLGLAALLPAAIAQAQQPPSRASMEITCTPDPVPAGEWVIIQCFTRITNHDEKPIPAGEVNVATASMETAVPAYHWISYFHGGRYWPISDGTLTFPTDVIPPGGTFESTVTELSQMSEGTWRGTATFTVDDSEIASVDLQQTASGDAPALPDDIEVTTRLVNGRADAWLPLPTGVYETKVLNKGSTAVTELTVSQRYDYAELVKAEPRPTSATHEEDYNLLSWDLSAFGLDSLAPGESLLVRTEFGPVDGEECGSVSESVVVEAKSGDSTQRYGASPEDAVLLGECNFDDNSGVPGGQGGPDGTFGDPAMLPPAAGPFGVVSLASGGEGAEEKGFDAVWTAAFLATAGAGLVGAALVARRRLRP